MVPRRTAQRVSVRVLSLQYCPHRLNRQSGRKRCDLIPIRTEWSAQAKLTPARGGHSLELVQIMRGMDAQQRLARRGRGRLRVQFRPEASGAEEVHQPSLGLGVFRQASTGQRLHQTAYRRHERVVSTRVPKTAFVPKECCAHARSMGQLSKAAQGVDNSVECLRLGFHPLWACCELFKFPEGLKGVLIPASWHVDSSGLQTGPEAAVLVAMRDDPTDTELAARYAPRLIAEREALLAASEQGAQARAVVTLDQQSVGRLSRMDALQGQAMAQGLETRRAARLAAISAALTRIEDVEFGWCADCGDFIGHGRLEADPCAYRCVGCAKG